MTATAKCECLVRERNTPMGRAKETKLDCIAIPQVAPEDVQDLTPSRNRCVALEPIIRNVVATDIISAYTSLRSLNLTYCK